MKVIKKVNGNSRKLKPGVPSSFSKEKANKRMIKLTKPIPKEFWYSPLAGVNMQAYLFHGYSDALSVTFDKHLPISHTHFSLVKYVGDQNSDVR